MTPERLQALTLDRMPNIIVTSNEPDRDGAAVLWTERVPVELLDDPHLASQLIERVKWAIRDAEQDARR